MPVGFGGPARHISRPSGGGSPGDSVFQVNACRNSSVLLMLLPSSTITHFLGHRLPPIVRYSPDYLEGFFWAPLCQAALREGAGESATRLLKTASETRLLRHLSASLRE